MIAGATIPAIAGGSDRMAIGLTGASGQLGRLTADALLERVDPADIVLVTRDPGKLEEYAERGVTVRHGDFREPAALPDAFAGVERLLLISGADIGERVAQHTAAIEAAREAGVRHVAYTSILNPSEANPAAVAPEHRGTEEALRASGLEWTMLRNGIYADMQVQGLEAAIATGRHVHNWGDGVIAHVSRADCAGAAAAVLSGEGHAGQAYDVTGPVLLSGAGMAALASEVGGVPVEAVAVDDDTWVAGMVEHAGLPEPVARFLATFGQAVREGQLDQCTSAVEDLTGRPPIGLRELLSASVAAATSA
jgi:NAD(P)H dehydrogenase (quinone)